MPPTDNSKGTAFITWCNRCKRETKTTVKDQRVPQPKCCAFCRGDVIVESIKTFPRPGA